MASSKAELLERLYILSLSLIYDRSQSDVDYLLSLERVPFDDLNAEEKAFLNSPQKGAYNYTDLNRVGLFCNTIVELLQNYYGTITDGYSEIITDWQNVLDPTQDQLEHYINSINLLRSIWFDLLVSPSAYYLSTVLPTTGWQGNEITIYDGGFLPKYYNYSFKINLSEEYHRVLILQGNEYEELLRLISSDYVSDEILRSNGHIVDMIPIIRALPVTEDGQMTFICETDTPQIDIPINIARTFQNPDEISHIYDGITLKTANAIEKVIGIIYDGLINRMLKNDSLYCGQLRGQNSSSVITCGSPYLIGVKNSL